MRYPVLILVLLLASLAGACSTFLLTNPEEGEIIFGRSYDFEVGDGMLVTNKSGVSKVAFIPYTDTAATWVSRYGSLTFNQFGRETPQGGINEAGLVVELMWLDETTYPEADERPAVGELQWIQYQLDTAATVEEVLASDETVRISFNAFTPLHYLVADATGDCAVVEFIDGEMVVHRGDELPIAALTNNTYDDSMTNFSEWTEPVEELTSLERFCRAADMVSGYVPCEVDDTIEYAFSTLEAVTTEGWTQWSIVYDIPNRRVNYYTAINPERRSVELDSFDFACETPVLVLDVDTGAGAVDDLFIEYSYEINRELVGRVYGAVEFLQGLPTMALNYVAIYPERQTCE